MLGTTARASLLRPFGAFEQAVRWNCPWFRNNFRPSFFPFKLEDKLKRQSVEARTKTRGGRLLLMRKVLRESLYLGWGHRPTPREKRINTPL
uniref:Secreted protein n=1 Tax=Plectus sambesii TaxID=2011161 RepID=A0A914V567_9BILA